MGIWYLVPSCIVNRYIPYILLQHVQMYACICTPNTLALSTLLKCCGIKIIILPINPSDSEADEALQCMWHMTCTYWKWSPVSFMGTISTKVFNPTIITIHVCVYHHHTQESSMNLLHSHCDYCGRLAIQIHVHTCIIEMTLLQIQLQYEPRASWPTIYLPL